MVKPGVRLVHIDRAEERTTHWGFCCRMRAAAVDVGADVSEASRRPKVGDRVDRWWIGITPSEDPDCNDSRTWLVTTKGRMRMSKEDCIENCFIISDGVMIVGIVRLVSVCL